MHEKIRDEAIAALNKCVQDEDTECAHAEADGVLCNILVELGFQEVVDKYNEIDKWYA